MLKLKCLFSNHDLIEAIKNGRNIYICVNCSYWKNKPIKKKRKEIKYF